LAKSGGFNDVLNNVKGIVGKFKKHPPKQDKHDVDDDLSLDDKLDVEESKKQQKKPKFDTTVEDLFNKRKSFVNKLSLGTILLIIIGMAIAALFIWIMNAGDAKTKRNEVKEDVSINIGEDNIWKYTTEYKLKSLNEKMLDFKKETRKTLEDTKEELKYGVSEINEKLNSSIDEIKNLIVEQNEQTKEDIDLLKDEVSRNKEDMKEYANEALGESLKGFKAPRSSNMLPVPSTIPLITNTKLISPKKDEQLYKEYDKLAKKYDELVQKASRADRVNYDTLRKYESLFNKYNDLAYEYKNTPTPNTSENAQEQYKELSSKYTKLSDDYAKLASEVDDSREYEELSQKYKKLSDEYRQIASKPKKVYVKRTVKKVVAPKKDTYLYKEYEKLSKQYKDLYKIKRKLPQRDPRLLEEYKGLYQKYEDLAKLYEKSSVPSSDSTIQEQYSELFDKYSELANGYKYLERETKKKDFAMLSNKYDKLAKKYDSLSQQAAQQEHEALVEITLDDEKMFADVTVQKVEQTEEDSLMSTLDSYDVDEKEDDAPFHLMTGFAKAILLTGVSAPTFGSGLLNPKPVLFSIDSDLVIANDDSEDIRDCMLIGSSTGNMNTERAEIQITKISCSIVDHNGRRKKVEESGAPLGWVIGEDGKYGLKGRLVDSAGKVVMRELSVGFLQGVYSAFSNSNAASTPTFLSGTTTSSGDTPLVAGIRGGASSALEKLATYYEKMLDGMYPVIDVKAGRYVTILFKGGESVDEDPYRRISIRKQTRMGVEDKLEVDLNDW
jgi:hypothetical protein